GTERPGAIDGAVGGVRRDDLIRRLLLLDPLLESGDRIERIRTLAAAAVAHPRHHEQTIAVLQVGLLERLRHAVEVIDAVARRNLRIAPAVILNQLAAAIEKRR